MRRDLQLIKVVWVWLTAMWSITAWAAESTFAADLSAIPLEAVKWTILLSFIGGAAATTNKIASPTFVTRSLWLEIIKDVLASLVAGLVTFFLFSWWGAPYWLQAAAITIAGYGGSRVTEYILSNGLFAWLDKIFGKARETP